ncbi:MAG: ribokinase [Gammaproteobacteria bacterium]|nr:ribokinase [Gammaproteobacteria bacterium]NNF59953.1 ribokinase [Gammaproteobacteria bacterium]NNM19683.1 ribokinase [Gammaproteobacteria bacterium]
MSDKPAIVVVGSVNLDLVAHAPRLPVPGETVTNATLARYPGGKGANQALAAHRLGARVFLCACTGGDATADEALALLRNEGVDLTRCVTDKSKTTGVALIAVAPDGENQIVVAPGANRRLTPYHLELSGADALICQLEVPMATVAAAAARFEGLFCINLAPATEVPDEILQRADLIVMNETESLFFGSGINACKNLVAITYGERGAVLKKNGEVIAEAAAPRAEVVDTTGAGDTFTAALTLALLEEMAPGEALEFACAAATLATTRAGAQTALPRREELETYRQQLAAQ